MSDKHAFPGLKKPWSELPPPSSKQDEPLNAGSIDYLRPLSASEGQPDEFALWWDKARPFPESMTDGEFAREVWNAARANPLPAAGVEPDKELETMVRDFTELGKCPKSEVRRRISEYVARQLEEMRQQDAWKALSVTAIAAENPSVSEYVAQLESQLAELRGENERLKSEADITKQLESAKSPCGHAAQYAYSEDGGKYIYCYVCDLSTRNSQLEQLQAEIAERNKLLHGKFGFVPSKENPGKCGCAYCTRDVDALADHAAEMEMQLPYWKDQRAILAEAKLEQIGEMLTNFRGDLMLLSSVRIQIPAVIITLDALLAKVGEKARSRDVKPQE